MPTPPCSPTTTSSTRGLRSSLISTRMSGSGSSRAAGGSSSRPSPTWPRCGRKPRRRSPGACGGQTSLSARSARNSAGSMISHWRRTRSDDREQRVMATGQPRAGSAPERPGSSTLMRVTLLAGPVLSMVDSSVVNVAVPVIVRDLHTSLGTAAWTVSGYLLGLAGGLAVSPWLARRFGTMRAYTAVLLGFTLASAACALAPDVGLLISGFGWRSVFLINVPIGLAALAAAVFAGAPGPTGAGDPAARPDVLGFALLGAGLSMATYGASQGPASGWLSARSAPAWLGGLLLMAGYAAWAHRRSSGTGPPAAVSLELLRSPRWAATLLLCCVASVVLFSMLFLAPVFLQQVQRHSPPIPGLALLPQGVVMGFASALGNVIVGSGRTGPAGVYSVVVAGA